MADKEPPKKKTSDDDFENLSDEEKIESLIKSLEEKSQSQKKPSDEAKPKKKETSQEEKKSPKADNESLKKASKKPSYKPRPFKERFIMIKFGGAYHPNFTLNLLISYWVNLVLVVAILEVFNLGRFPEQLWIPMVFVLMYTGFEWLFREWMIQRYSKIVVMSFGLVYFVGYSFLFFMLDALFFTNIQIFNSEIEVVAFTGIFMILRFLLSYLVQRGLNWRKS